MIISPSRTFEHLENYKGAIISISKDKKTYLLYKFTEDKKSYVYRKEYKSLKWCKNFIDKQEEKGL